MMNATTPRQQRPDPVKPTPVVNGTDDLNGATAPLPAPSAAPGLEDQSDAGTEGELGDAPGDRPAGALPEGSTYVRIRGPVHPAFSDDVQGAQ